MDTCITQRPAPFEDEGVDMEAMEDSEDEYQHRLRQQWPRPIYVSEGLFTRQEDDHSRRSEDHQDPSKIHKNGCWYIMPEDGYEFGSDDDSTDSDCSSIASSSASSSSARSSSSSSAAQQNNRRRRRDSSSSSSEEESEEQDSLSYDSMDMTSEDLNESNDMVVIPSTVLDLIKNSQ